MPSERLQRRIEALLDEADTAMASGDWAAVQARARSVLAADPDNADGHEYLAMAERGLAAAVHAQEDTDSPGRRGFNRTGSPRLIRRRPLRRPPLPGRGRPEAGLSRPRQPLDRDVAFCAIKTEGLERGRERIRREAQAMGRLGGHPNLVTIYDIGDDNGEPYLV